MEITTAEAADSLVEKSKYYIRITLGGKLDGTRLLIFRDRNRKVILSVELNRSEYYNLLAETDEGDIFYLFYEDTEVEYPSIGIISAGDLIRWSDKDKSFSLSSPFEVKDGHLFRILWRHFLYLYFDQVNEAINDQKEKDKEVTVETEKKTPKESPKASKEAEPQETGKEMATKKASTENASALVALVNLSKEAAAHTVLGVKDGTYSTILNQVVQACARSAVKLGIPEEAVNSQAFQEITRLIAPIGMLVFSEMVSDKPKIKQSLKQVGEHAARGNGSRLSLMLGEEFKDVASSLREMASEE